MWKQGCNKFYLAGNNMQPLALKHFQQPQHIGTLPHSNCTGVASIESPATGRYVTLYLQVDALERIIAIRYKVRGCHYTIATLSYLATHCQNQLLVEAKKLTRQTLVRTLRIPSDRLHCAAIAEDVLKQAINNYQQKQRGSDEQKYFN